MGNGDVGEVVRAVQRNGYLVTKERRGGHYRVRQRDGSAVISRGRAVMIPSSPSDNHWRENLVRQLIAAEVLDHDPFKAGGQPRTRPTPASNGNGNDSPPAGDAHTANLARTLAVRGRFEPIVAQLGGWHGGGRRSRDARSVTVIEFTEVMWRWAEPRGHLPEGTARRGIYAATTDMKNGRTLGTKLLPLFEEFAEELWRHAPDAAAAAARYSEVRNDLLGAATANGDLSGREPGARYGSAEIAKMLGVSTKTVRRWISRGVLQAERTSTGAFLIDLEDARKAKGAPPRRMRRDRSAAVSSVGELLAGVLAGALVDPDARPAPAAQQTTLPLRLMYHLARAGNTFDEAHQLVQEVASLAHPGLRQVADD